MNNFTELFQMGKARPREEHAAWLTGDACKHHNKSIRAMAALCVGLQLYDTGKRQAPITLHGSQVMVCSMLVNCGVHNSSGPRSLQDA